MWAEFYLQKVKFSKLLAPEKVCVSRILPAEAGILIRIHICCVAVLLRNELNQAFTATFFLFSNKSLIDLSCVVAFNTGLCCSHRGSNFSEFGQWKWKKIVL